MHTTDCVTQIYFNYRLLQLIDLPTLDGVLAHDAVDGKQIEHNVSVFSRLFKPTHKTKTQASSVGKY